MTARSWPWLSAGLAGAALLLGLLPGAPAWLEYDRTRVAGGEWWRPLSGQLVHWTPRMALVDLGALLVLGAVLEARRRWTLLVTGIVSLLAVGAGIPLLAPGIERYRGASGVASALFAAVAVLSLRAPTTPAVRAGAGLLALAFGAKLAWEVASGQPLAAGALPDGVRVLPLAHLLGAASGALVALVVPGPYTRGRSGRDRARPIVAQAVPQ